MASAIPADTSTLNDPPPSSHRLPTVSAAQALHELESSRTRCVSTGLRDLDAALQGRELGTGREGGESSSGFVGGVSKGKVTEIWGPPGVGKTALGIQLAASALCAGEGAVWVDASHPVPGPRFSQILSSFKTPSSSLGLPGDGPTPVENLTHYSTPTLAHLLALISHETANYEASNVSLMIIDSFSTLISTAFPRTIGSIPTPSKPGRANPTSRKLPMLQHIVGLLQRLAASRNLAVVVLSQCVTKMRPGAGAVLVPAISMAAWEQGLGGRVVLFRDWGWNDEEGNAVTDVRFAEVVKADGTVVSEGRRRLVGFSIGTTGLRPLAVPKRGPHPEAARLEHVTHPAPAAVLAVPRKRKLSAAELEIPDSEGEDDEDYGWAEEDDEAMPPMPPQWQGSEDILVPAEGELEENEGEEEDAEDEDDEGSGKQDGEDLPDGDTGDATAGRVIRMEVEDSDDDEI